MCKSRSSHLHRPTSEPLRPLRTFSLKLQGSRYSFDIVDAGKVPSFGEIVAISHAMVGVYEFEFEVVCHVGSVREMIKIRNVGDAYNRSYLCLAKDR